MPLSKVHCPYQIETRADGSKLVRSAMQAPLYGQKGLFTLARQLLSSCVESSLRVPLEAGKSLYTGLILDARGQPYSPCMSARILTDTNREVWNGIIALLDNEALPGPPLEFSRSMAQALEKPRIGKIPMILRITQVRGVSRCDVVVTDADLDFMQQNRIDSVLRDAKVVVVF
jgi:hypothetical protein